MNQFHEKRRIRLLYAIIACLAFIIVLPSYVPARPISDRDIVPTVLSDGSDQEISHAQTYNLVSDGNQLFRLDVPQNGAIVMHLHVGTAGYVAVELFTEKEASGIPIYLQAQCTADRGNTGTVTRYLSKGTYYLRFPPNTYEATFLAYPYKNQTLKNGSPIATYNDYSHVSVYTYKAPSNGCITISTKMSAESCGSLTAVLCNAKGTPLTERSIFNSVENNQITYAVKKGVTYKLKTEGLNVNDSIYCQMMLKHTAINEKSGSTKKKAVSVQFGTKASGIVLAEDSASKADWYKIKNPKKQQLLLNYSGSITSGSLMMDVYDAKGKKLDSYSVISNIGEKKEDLMHNADGGTKMPAGTYYLRVTKSRKTSTGIYSFSLSGK